MPILQQKNNDDLKHPGDDPNVTDPQENEKDGNVFGRVFDAVFGNSDGKESISSDEPDPNPESEVVNRAADDTIQKDETERDIIDDEENSRSL